MTNDIKLAVTVDAPDVERVAFLFRAYADEIERFKDRPTGFSASFILDAVKLPPEQAENGYEIWRLK